MSQLDTAINRVRTAMRKFDQLIHRTHQLSTRMTSLTPQIQKSP